MRRTLRGAAAPAVRIPSENVAEKGYSVDMPQLNSLRLREHCR